METHTWIVTERQRNDVEMLLIGGFHPLNGFLSQADYESVLSANHLLDGQLWPIPITLDVNEIFAEKIVIGDQVILCDADNSALATMTITSKWKPNKLQEAQAVFATNDTKHAGVDYLFNRAGDWYLGGPLNLIQIPKHYDFAELRHSPQILKNIFKQLDCRYVVGFQTRNPIHRAHMELTLRAAKEHDAHILLHPVVGLTKSGDIDYYTRVRCYKKILHYYPKQQVTLSLLPLAMRMAGPREALLHAIIRKNYGCTHFIIGRDHAGPGNDSHDKPFYQPYAAQEFVQKYQEEIGIKIVTFQEMVYVKERKHYCPLNELKHNETALTLSGTKLREALLAEKNIPEWFSFPEIISELRQSCPAKHQQGLTIFFTGLSGSGKTTLAKALLAKLMSEGKRNITLLDGDVMRKMLASELGFTKADRDLNIRRIGFVAAQVTKTGGMALCAAIAPYANVRNENRHLISQSGAYIEVYISTPLAECEKRDTKGLYAKARRGELNGLTGVDDPYEVPNNAELTIDTAQLSIEESVNKIISFMQKAGYLRLEDQSQVFSLSRKATEEKIDCI